MNIELLKKLIRLANNNPNDNEANLAARKVCKMLTDYNFTVEKPKSSINAEVIYRDMEEMIRKMRKEPSPYYNSADEAYYNRKRERGFGFYNRQLKCRTCKQTKDTKFVGLEELFECNECIWTHFKREGL